MKINNVVIHHIESPLKVPFGTSYGTYAKRESLILEVQDESGESGWGEVVAFSHPWYTEETIKTAYSMLKDYLIPLLLENQFSHPSQFVKACSWMKRNNMSKAGVEGALWDLYAKLEGVPLYRILGGDRNKVDVGVVIGLNDTNQMLRQIGSYVEEGYKRFKVKISPQRDVEIIKELRKVFPNLPLMVDANSAYTLNDMKSLKGLDEFGLIMIEQPLGYFDFVDHAVLQRSIETPICLDESISSLDDVKTAHALGSCDIINIKSGRVGGLYESIRIHNYCQATGIPVWCGGMLEFGISRLQNLALATLPNFTIPADLSASNRYYEEDIIMPEVHVKDGEVVLSEVAGMGAEVNRHVLEKVCKHKQVMK